MLKLEFTAHSVEELHGQLLDALDRIAPPHPSPVRPSFFAGGISALGLNPAPLASMGEPAQMAADQVYQAGFKQGFNAGFGEACDRATMEQSDFAEPERTPAATVALAESHERRAQELRKAVAWRLEQEHNLDQRQRPEGMKDYMPADVAQQQANQVGPGPDFEGIAEANRKTAVATGQARQEYYAEREGEQRLGASVSSPEMVARSLAKQGRTLPGE